MDMSPPSKEEVVLKLLEEGDTMICLDARCAGVQVPKAHCHNPNLRLILNLNFPQPIEVTAAGIGANLAFGGRRFACYVPMEALWAAFNPQTMQGIMWPSSMPPEVLAEVTAQQTHETKKTRSSPPAGDAASPQVIAGKSTARSNPKGHPPAQKRGHLRVIK